MSRISSAFAAHWPMNDNAASTAVVDAVGSNPGVYTDNVTPVNTSTGSVAGVNSLALDLDTDEWIDVNGMSVNVKTITFWCNPDSVAGNDYPIDLDYSNYISIESGVVTVTGFAGTQVIYVNGDGLAG